MICGEIIQCTQNSPEWFAARLGRVTGSRIADVLAKGKGSAPSVTRSNYVSELAAERISGRVCEDGKFQTTAMKQGSEREATARQLYAFMNNLTCTTVGFVVHPEIKQAGASPDTLVGETGLAEHKCPIVKTHIETLMGGPIDGGYMKQMMWQLACTGREWVDFVSYHPTFPDEMQLHIRRVHRDDGLIKDMEAEVRRFLSEVDETVEKLRKLYPPMGAMEAA